MKIKSTNDKEFNDVNHRIVISRDESCDWCRDEYDHMFVLWSNTRNMRGDKNAESPFEEDDDGNVKLKNGIVAFSVSIYEHSGISYHLGDYHGVDAEFDSCDEAYYLWCDKERFEEFQGSGSWGKNDRKEVLERVASSEIEELNLDAQGSYYQWKEEVKKSWTKIYEDGTETKGCDWEIVNSCGCYLGDSADMFDFQVGIPVFADKTAEWFVDEEI